MSLLLLHSFPISLSLSLTPSSLSAILYGSFSSMIFIFFLLFTYSLASSSFHRLSADSVYTIDYSLLGANKLSTDSHFGCFSASPSIYYSCLASSSHRLLIASIIHLLYWFSTWLGCTINDLTINHNQLHAHRRRPKSYIVTGRQASHIPHTHTHSLTYKHEATFTLGQLSPFCVHLEYNNSPFYVHLSTLPFSSMHIHAQTLTSTSFKINWEIKVFLINPRRRMAREERSIRGEINTSSPCRPPSPPLALVLTPRPHSLPSPCTLYSPFALVLTLALALVPFFKGSPITLATQHPSGPYCSCLCLSLATFVLLHRRPRLFLRSPFTRKFTFLLVPQLLLLLFTTTDVWTADDDVRVLLCW